MKGNASILIACLIIGLLILIASITQEAVELWQAQAARPETVTDMVMRSRQTPTVSPSRTTGWLGAGLLALVLLLMSGTIFMMRGGADLLKQWRLTWKVTRRPEPLSSAPTITYTDLQQVPTARPVTRLEGSQDETAHHTSTRH